MAMHQYRIMPIDYSMAMELILRHHYLHRRCPCSFAFGLFKGWELVGSVVYGTPSSAPLRSGICGPDERDNVIELTRLWIQDVTPKNAESYLIGNTIPLVDKEIIVSYAEIEAGHVGTVYQATNWIYTGLSAKRTNWHIEGAANKHSQTIADQHSAAELRAMHGDAFSLVDRPRKHRYVYFNCNKRRRAELLAALRYPILPYPKKETTP